MSNPFGIYTAALPAKKGDWRLAKRLALCVRMERTRSGTQLGHTRVRLSQSNQFVDPPVGSGLQKQRHQSARGISSRWPIGDSLCSKGPIYSITSSALIKRKAGSIDRAISPVSVL